MMMYNLSSFIEELKNEAVLIESNAEDLSIKKLTKNNPTMREKFEEVKK